MDSVSKGSNQSDMGLGQKTNKKAASAAFCVHLTAYLKLAEKINIWWR